MLLKLPTPALGVFFLLAAAGAHAQQQYTVTNLGTLPMYAGSSPTSWGAGINAGGLVVGIANNSMAYVYDSQHPYSYYAYDEQNDSYSIAYNSMYPLGTLGGTYSTATAINASGHITGASYQYSTIDPRAFLYSNGTMKDLGTLGGATSVGTGINASDQVVGSSSTIGIGNMQGPEHAFLYSNGSMQDLGTLGGATSRAYGINSSGQITGLSSNNPNNSVDYHAFLYSNGSMQDLGTLGGQTSEGYGINDSGQVTGRSFTSNGYQHAFVYSNGLMLDIDPLGTSSGGYAVNSSGQVTGYAYNSQNESYAFLYSDDQLIDLNSLIGSASSLYRLNTGTAINDAGQIVVNGTVKGSPQKVAFLLTPVPLPGTAWLMLSAFGVLGILVRNRIPA